MRRFKAKVCVTEDGKVGEAYTGDRLIRDVNTKGYAKEIEGYIEIPLSKGRSRQKGNSLELIIAKDFSNWLYGRPDILRRTPLSGGWGSGKLGDITMDPAQAAELNLKPPKMYVECKNREGLLDESFWRWFETGKPSTITDVIKDTIAKAKANRWFLILKGRGTSPYVLTPVGAHPNPEHTLQFISQFGVLWFFPVAHIKEIMAGPYNEILGE